MMESSAGGDYRCTHGWWWQWSSLSLSWPYYPCTNVLESDSWNPAKIAPIFSASFLLLSS